MGGGDGEVCAGAGDGVGIAVAFGAGHGERGGGDQIAEGGALAAGGDVGALGLGDLQKVEANTGEADGLSGGGACVAGGNLLQGIVVDAEGDGGKNDKRDQRAHGKSVTPGCRAGNRTEQACAVGNNGAVWGFGNGRRC